MNDSQKMYLHVISPLEIVARLLEIADRHSNAHGLLESCGVDIQHFPPEPTLDLALDLLGVPEDPGFLRDNAWILWGERNTAAPDRIQAFIMEVQQLIAAWAESDGSTTCN